MSDSAAHERDSFFTRKPSADNQSQGLGITQAAREGKKAFLLDGSLAVNY